MIDIITLLEIFIRRQFSLPSFVNIDQLYLLNKTKTLSKYICCFIRNMMETIRSW